MTNATMNSDLDWAAYEKTIAARMEAMLEFYSQVYNVSLRRAGDDLKKIGHNHAHAMSVCEPFAVCGDRKGEALEELQVQLTDIPAPRITGDAKHDWGLVETRVMYVAKFLQA